MTQTSRPNSDVADAEWVNHNGVTASLNNLINETDAELNDDAHMKSVSDGSTSPLYCKIALQNTIDDPQAALDDHKVKYRAIGGSGGMMMMGAPALKVQLHDTTITDYANNPIAEHTNSGLGDETMWEPYATFTISLSSSEAGNIESYDDLQIWFLRVGVGDSGEYAIVSQAWFECAEVEEEGADTTGSAFLLFLE